MEKNFEENKPSKRIPKTRYEITEDRIAKNIKKYNRPTPNNIKKNLYIVGKEILFKPES